jgi:hypothetical protein
MPYSYIEMWCRKSAGDRLNDGEILIRFLADPRSFVSSPKHPYLLWVKIV